MTAYRVAAAQSEPMERAEPKPAKPRRPTQHEAAVEVLERLIEARENEGNAQAMSIEAAELFSRVHEFRWIYDAPIDVLRDAIDAVHPFRCGDPWLVFWTLEERWQKGELSR